MLKLLKGVELGLRTEDSLQGCERSLGYAHRPPLAVYNLLR